MLCILNNALCIDYKAFYIILMLSIILLIWSNYFAISNKHYNNAKKKYQQIVIKNMQPNTQSHSHSNLFQDRIENKLRAPYKSNDSYPYTVPINIRTRGSLPDFQQIGYISDPSNTNQDSQRLPLMSRPKWYGSSEYESYVVDGSRNAIKIPLTNKKEISNDDSVTVNELNGNYTATVYDNDLPKYIPYIG